MARLMVLGEHLTERFPEEETVEVWPATCQKVGQGPSGTGPTTTVSWEVGERGLLELSLPIGLAADKLTPRAPYVLYAEVDGDHRYVKFVAEENR